MPNTYLSTAIQNKCKRDDAPVRIIVVNLKEYDAIDSLV